MSKKSKTAYRITAVVILLAMAISLVGCGGQKTALDPQNPVTVTIWNYYNGDQLAAFEKMVEEFNMTTGTEKGIVAVSLSQSDINTLADSLLDSVSGKAGAQEKPDLAAVYAETAYILNQQGALASMDSYFSEEELKAYVPGFIDEGRFAADGSFLLFPILKSTELFSANETDWAPFAEATGVTIESIKSLEDLTAAAKTYYEWTDSLTPDVPEDGKALYGRDSMANYIYVGAKQLGHEIFKVEKGNLTVDLDKDTFRTLWDNYYIPYINGYFGAYAKFRSEDCKMGKILGLTSSSSSVSYLPTAVTSSDDTTHEITTYISKAFSFKDAVSNTVVQQGASYCLLMSTPAKQEGAVEFLKWFSQPERNKDFALMSGYSPVTLEANNEEAIRGSLGDASTPKAENILKALLVSADMYNTDEAYAAKPFNGSKDVRSIMEDAMQDTADADRAAVIGAMAAGATRQQALATYVTDSYFETWFSQLCENVNAALEQ